jgi:Tol biopolymer transport system component
MKIFDVDSWVFRARQSAFDAASANRTRRHDRARSRPRRRRGSARRLRRRHAGGNTRLIAFARAPATNVFSNLYLLQTDGSLRRLTHGGNDGAPVWSPDGQRLAFQRAHRSRTTLLVANVDGSGRRELPNSVSGTVDWVARRPAPALRRRRQAYLTNDEWSERATLLDAAPARADDAGFSPDGTRIAFSLGTDGGRADVYAMNADGSGRAALTRLGPGDGRPMSPVWSPDGRQVAFLLPGSLRVANADGSGGRVLARFPEGIFPSSLAWSPDGRSIAFARLELGGNRRASGIYVVGAEGGDVDRDGSDQVELTQGGWADTEPSWRPAVG